MAGTTLPNIGLIYAWALGENFKTDMDFNLALLDRLAQMAVADRDLTTPPGSPADGDTYIVAATATGAWLGHEDDIAVYFNSQWNFYTPKLGWTAWLVDEDFRIYWDGAAWSEESPATLPALSGHALEILRVNAGASAVEWFDPQEVIPQKNLLINPEFRVWQRGTTRAGLTSGAFMCDRYRWVEVSDAVITASKDTDVPTGHTGSSLGISVTTADASIAASDIAYVDYRMEGNDFVDSNVGTADAKTVTLSFWVKSSKTGVHCLNMADYTGGAPTRGYIVEYSVSSANTWEFKTITVDLDTGGTWTLDNTNGFRLRWILAAGTDWQGTADQWNSSAAAADVATSNQVNVLDTISNVFKLKDVKLEYGSVASPFVSRPIAEELRMCQRFYERWDAGESGNVLTLMQGRSTSLATGVYKFEVEKVKIPTLTLSTSWDLLGVAGESLSTLTSVDGLQSSAINWNDAGTPFTTGQAYSLSSSGTSDYLEVDAEI